MIKKIIFLFFLLEILSLNAQTTINANSKVFGLWKKANSPYYIKGNISVPRDSTLTIESGVQVRFDGKYIISVYGNIKAIGKAGDSIRFYPQDTMNRWRGIRYWGRNQSRDSATFSYCKFEYTGPKLSNNESCLRLTRGNFNINNSLFTKNTSVLFSNSIAVDSVLSLTIDKCYFYRNNNFNIDPSITQQIFGVIFVTQGTVSNCKFISNSSYNPYNDLDKSSVNGDGSGGIIGVMDLTNPNASINVINCEFTNNNCALKGAGVDIFFRKNGKILIKGCKFTNNFTGRYGCISFNGDNSYTKGNMKVVIDGCQFKNNRSANSTTGYGEASCIGITTFSSNDSLLIKNNVFEKNISRSAVYLYGRTNDKLFFLDKNIFKNNYSGCLESIVNCQLYSTNNLYYNNLWSTIYAAKSASNDFYSINDLYAYNGLGNTDTLWLDQQYMFTFSGLYHTSIANCLNQASTSGVYRNCIFWNNFNGLRKLEHILNEGVRTNEVSNCIMNGNTDSTIDWYSESGGTRPNPVVILKQNINSSNPLFVNPPSDYGPDVNTDNVDFHLINSCAQTSPAYNAGLNSALPNYNTLTDKDGNPRLKCDVVDIGPYEFEAKKKYAQISSEPQDKAGCFATPYTLSALASCGMNLQYYWQKKNSNNVWSNISGANQLNYSSTLPDSGLYRLIVKQPECLIEDTSRIVKVSQYPTPNPSLGNDTTIKNNQTLTLNAGNGSSFLWNTGAISQTLLIDGKTLPLGKKTYKVKVGNSYGCFGEDSVSITIEDNTSLANLIKSGWQVYPNPTINSVNLQSPNGESFEWKLIDIMGKIIQEGESHGKEMIDLIDLPEGNYFISIRTSNHNETIKLIKQ